MPPVTVEQVVALIDARRITRFEHSVCPNCHRGERFFFYHNHTGIKEMVMRQLGCDCAWRPSDPSSYQEFIDFLNQHPPDDRAKLWADLYACGRDPAPKPTSGSEESEATIADAEAHFEEGDAVPADLLDLPPMLMVETVADSTDFIMPTATGEQIVKPLSTEELVETVGLAVGDSVVAQRCPFCDGAAGVWISRKVESGDAVRPRCGLYCINATCLLHRLKPEEAELADGATLTALNSDWANIFPRELEAWNTRAT